MKFAFNKRCSYLPDYPDRGWMIYLNHSGWGWPLAGAFAINCNC